MCQRKWGGGWWNQVEMERQAILSEGIVLLMSEMTTLIGKSKKLKVAVGGIQGSRRVSSRFCSLFWEQRESANTVKMDVNTLGWLKCERCPSEERPRARNCWDGSEHSGGRRRHARQSLRAHLCFLHGATESLAHIKCPTNEC